MLNISDKRTKEEALVLAEELKRKLEKGDNFVKLVEEFSDDESQCSNNDEKKIDNTDETNNDNTLSIKYNSLFNNIDMVNMNFNNLVYILKKIT